MEKKFKFRVLMVLALAIGLTAGATNAKLIAYEPFDYPVDDILEGQTGGTGWDGPWEGEIYGVVAQMYAGNLFAYGEGNHWEHVAVGAEENYVYMTRDLATPLLDDGSTYWVSYQYQKVNTGCTVCYNGWQGMLVGNIWVGKGYQEAGGTWHDYYCLHDEMDLEKYDVTTDPVTTLALLVLKVETDGTEAEDNVYLWINPAPGATPATNTADADLTIALAEEEDWDDNDITDYRVDYIVLDYGSGEGDPEAMPPIPPPDPNADNFKLDEVRIGTLYQDVAGQGKLATDPQPAEGEINVDPALALLQWTAPTVVANPPVEYDVYFGIYGGDDPNFVIDNPKIKDNTVGTTVAPPALAMGTQYYWRVDPRDPGATTGGIWPFKTWPAAPIITTQPAVVQTVPAGGNATVTVVSGGNVGGGHNYQWYKEGTPDVQLTDGGKISGATTSTLTITNVQLAEEGYYYCRVTNGSGSTDSDSGRLLTKRLMAHWKFQNSLACEVDSRNDGTSPVAVSYVAGIDGQAVKIEDPNKFVMVNDANALGLLNDITVSMWVEPNEVAYALLFVPQAGEPYYGDTGSVYLELDGWYDDPGNTFSGWVTDSDADAAVRNSVTVGAWNHIVFVYDTTNQVARHHVNGNQMAIDGVYEQAIDAAVLPNLPPLSMGQRNIEDTWGIFDQGLIDDVRVFNYPLSPLQIAELYNAFVPGGTDCFRPPEGDVNGDCKVNVVDYAELADSWLLEYNLVPDHITPEIPD